MTADLSDRDSPELELLFPHKSNRLVDRNSRNYRYVHPAKVPRRLYDMMRLQQRQWLSNFNRTFLQSSETEQ